MMPAKHQWQNLDLRAGNPSVTNVWSECIQGADKKVTKWFSTGALPLVPWPSEYPAVLFMVASGLSQACIFPKCTASSDLRKKYESVSGKLQIILRESVEKFNICR